MPPSAYMKAPPTVTGTRANDKPCSMALRLHFGAGTEPTFYTVQLDKPDMPCYCTSDPFVTFTARSFAVHQLDAVQQVRVLRLRGSVAAATNTPITRVADPQGMHSLWLRRYQCRFDALRPGHITTPGTIIRATVGLQELKERPPLRLTQCHQCTLAHAHCLMLPRAARVLLSLYNFCITYGVEA